MTVPEIKTLYAYNRWANGRIVGAAQPLDSKDFTRDLATSHRSVRGTLIHILWGEWLWLQRWRGESPKQIFDPEDFPDTAAIESRWRQVERQQDNFISGLDAERLDARVSYQNLQGQRWEYTLAHMMQHLANHSSYHRGQVVTLLRQLGQSAPATDFLVFFDERGE